MENNVLKQISIKTMVEVTEFLSNHSKEIESYGEDELTLNMNDVNEEIDGVYWVDYMNIFFEDENAGIRVQAINFGNGDWVTIRFIEA